MNYSTLDRFQGVWLGSIIGAALSKNTRESNYKKIVQYEFTNWIKTRDTIAQTIIEGQSTEFTLSQLTKILAEYYSNNFSDDVKSSLKISKVDLINRRSGAISIFLPLIMLQEDGQKIEDMYMSIISQYSLNPSNVTEVRQEIVIWSYLITLALNNKLQLGESNVSMIVKQALGGAEVRTTSLIEELGTASQAWERGLSLQWLADRLYQQDSEKDIIVTFSSAIVLSLYCFISTPRNFMLSVKRAAVIRSELSAIVTVLTASISGAYNGISNMPRNWLVAASDNPSYLQAQKTAERLFEIWLGVYNLDNLELLYDPEIHAVATPKIFQSRQNLKIISQKFTLS